MNELRSEGPESRTAKISPRELFIQYLPYLPWIIASVFVFLVLAFIKLRYSPEIYSVSGTILVQDQNSYGSQSDKLDAMIFDQPDRNLYDEIQIIRSRNMAKRVARALDMSIVYTNKGNVRSTLIYRNESPLELKLILLKDSSKTFSLPVTVLSENDFQMGADGNAYKFGQAFENAYGTFILSRTNIDLSQFKSQEYTISYAPLEQRANQIVDGLSVTQAGESTNILEVRFETENPKTGIDVVNALMKEYQNAGLEEKRKEAVSALRFINEQMDTVSYDLGGVERNLENYRIKNKVYIPEQQSASYFSSISELEREISKEGAKLENVNYLIRLLADTSNPNTQVASLLGIEEPTLLQQIQEFNKLQVQRQTILKTTTEANPLVKNLDASRSKLRLDIISNLSNIRQAFDQNLRAMQTKNKAIDQEVASIPSREKQLLDITRRQKILEELYSYLLQKKLETSISSASTISNVRVIEPATSSGYPVKPKRSSIYSLAIFIGLLIPSLIIFALEFFNDKVRTREDITKVIQEPILGEIGHSEDGKSIVVDKANRKFIAEQFRIIRSNLQYILPKEGRQVLVVTSSYSGEGKSFVSTNVAAAMALAGKRTAILEFDIRKPKIMSALQLGKQQGITNYILGNASVEQIVVPVPNVENLFVVPCGPVPPNPAEMLLSPRIEELFKELEKKFDFLIIDTAPVGLVADATILAKYAEASLYIIRHNYTYKKQLQIVREMATHKRLPKVSLIINDISSSGWYGSYYGYGGYGMNSYSYGYGSEYFEETSKGRGFLQSLFRRG